MSGERLPPLGGGLVTMKVLKTSKNAMETNCTHVCKYVGMVPVLVLGLQAELQAKTWHFFYLVPVHCEWWKSSG